MNKLLIIAVIAGGAYYWYTQHPETFGGAANNAANTVSTDASRAAGKAKSLR